MLCRHLPVYATEVIRGEEEYGGRFALGPHHIDWGAAANRSPRILALAARDHGKSFFWCFAYPLWMVDRVRPGKVGYIFSASEEQAIEHLDRIRQEVCGGGVFGEEGNPKLAHLLPLKIDSAKKIRFANGSEIRARGFGTRVRGGHPAWIVCDDVGNDEWIWSQAMRDKHIDYFLSAIEPMPGPGGQLVVVGTPFHALDLYNTLEEGGVFEVIKKPAIDPETGEPLWPQRYDLDALELKRRTLASSLRWSREYLCSPISDEASIFPSSLFEVPGTKIPYDLGDKAYWAQKNVTFYLGADLSMSVSAGGDYFVAIVLAVDSRGHRYIVDVIRAKGLGYQGQVDTIVDLAERWECQFAFIESNQFQRVITDMVIRQTDVQIKAFYTTGRGSAEISSQRRGMSKNYIANKNALDQGVPTLRMLLENKRLHFPYLPDSMEVTDVMISEMQAFGWADGKLQGVGAHDDTVMALWIADRAARAGGAFSAAFSEDDAEGSDPVEAGEAPLGLAGPPDPQEGEGHDDDIDFFGAATLDWRPQEGVGMSW